MTCLVRLIDAVIDFTLNVARVVTTTFIATATVVLLANWEGLL